MARFQFRLATLLRIRESARDERRAQLAEAFLADQKLNEHRAELESQAEALRQGNGRPGPGLLDVDRLLGAHRFQLLLMAQLQQVEVQSKKLAVEIEKRRQLLVAADREVRVLEKLRETWQARHHQEQQLQEMKQLDEVASRICTQPLAAERSV